MRTTFWLLILTLYLGCHPTGPNGANAQGAVDPAALPSCEWCGTGEAPAPLGWETAIAGPEEEGERLVLSGTVYAADGVTPTPGVVLYLYHTNSEGAYPKRGDETGNGRRHGYLRSWLRTDERGRYRVSTIRSAFYPTRTEPVHIHTTVQPPGGQEDWVDSVTFDDDPLLTPAHRSGLQNRGGSGVVTLERDERGVWHGTRDIVLVE